MNTILLGTRSFPLMRLFAGLADLLRLRNGVPLEASEIDEMTQQQNVVALEEYARDVI